MNQDTPASAIRPKDLGANSEALRQLLLRVPRDILSAVDIRYGLGGWARVLYEHHHPSLLGYEQDLETYRAAWKGAKVKLVNRRFEGQPYRADLLLADFNTLTVLNRKLLDEAVAAVPAEWVVFTDVARSKLHLNAERSYGLRAGATMDDYWRAFPLVGYRLVAWAGVHWAATTALYKKKTPAG